MSKPYRFNKTDKQVTRLDQVLCFVRFHLH